MVINLTQPTHGQSKSRTVATGTRPDESQLLDLNRFFTLIPTNHH